MIRRLRSGRLSKEGWRKAYAKRAASLTPYVAVESAGAERTIFLLPIREKAGIDRFMKPRWKEDRHLARALDALARLGTPAMRTALVDVGAHIGTTAITAVRRFGFSSAFAFEPEPANFRLLRANLVVNDLEGRIHAVNAAVSNRVGTEELKLRPAMGSKNRLLRRGEVAETTVSVPLTTLDALVRAGELDPAGVGLLWLDVEGHELEALEGARALRERSVPIVMEFAPRRLSADGRLDALRVLLGEHYTHAIDLRRRPGDQPELRPLDALDDLAEHYRRGFTDLLVLRHPSAVKV